ncbi:MAG: DUF3987 domain-containing protein [Salinivirgaceae bacterium]
MNLNIEFVLSSILYATSVTIGNSYQVKVRNGWNERASLFMVIVGETGVSKTPAISIALAPLIKKNLQYYKEWCLKDEQYQLEQALGAKELKEKGIESVIPKRKQIVIEDSTIDAIYRVHANNPKGLGVYFDEIIGFFNNMNRYNNGSEQEQWLMTWSGKSISVDRVSSKPILIPNPNISFIGGIQPQMLPDLFKDNREKNGFVERILFTNPKGLTKSPFPESNVPMSVFVNYEVIINRLIDLPVSLDEDGGVNSVILNFSSSAQAKYISFFNQNKDLLNSGTIPHKLRGFYSKMDIYVARFALILQMLCWACGEGDNSKVSEKAMDGAIILYNYYIENAKPVIDAITQPISLTNEHRKLFANELYLKNGYSYRDIGKILNVSHETIRKWVTPIVDS